MRVGCVLGNSIGAAYSGTKSDDELVSYLSALGEKFTSELSKRSMNILVPALTGTVLVPILTSELEQTFGIDFSDLRRQVLAGLNAPNGKQGKGKPKKKNERKAKVRNSRGKRA